MSQHDLAPIPTSVLRGLGDKVYDKRKSAALDVERLIREAEAARDVERTAAIIHMIIQYASSSQPNFRNGGLIALAAAAIALGPGVERHLASIMQPIFQCLTDQDSRVRYYACESLYNVAKVARWAILRYFNDIFDALARLTADPEISVKKGTELLNRVIIDIVSDRSVHHDEANDALRHEPPGPVPSTTPGSVALTPGLAPTQFNLPRFIPLLVERIHTINPFVRTFLVNWIAVLHSVPELEIVAFLPEFLEGLFGYLGDTNIEVRTNTQRVLGEFLKEIKDIVEIQRDRQLRVKANAVALSASTTAKSTGALLMSGPNAEVKTTVSPGDADKYNEGPTLPQAADRAPGEDGGADADAAAEGDANAAAEGAAGDGPGVAAPRAMREFTFNPHLDRSRPYVPGADTRLDFGRLTAILVRQAQSANQETKATALRWLVDFIQLTRDSMLTMATEIMEATLPNLAHPSKEIVRLAQDADAKFYQLAVELLTESNLVDKHVDLEHMVRTLMLPQFLKAAHEDTRLASLEWLLMLHRKFPTRSVGLDETETLQALLQSLGDSSEEVVRRVLQYLAQVLQVSSDAYFCHFITQLLTLLAADRRLLEARGSLVIRQLCHSLNAERIYRTFAEILERDARDLDFVAMMVQNLNIILITAPEMVELRQKLRALSQPAPASLASPSHPDARFFTILFRTWCHHPVAAFSLCLLSQAYQKASDLLNSFGELEITVSLLIQMDKLVQLLESPVFTYLRLQLLEPHRYPYLLKCLYGILMLLPQSSAFATLRNRLNAVGSMILLSQHQPPPSAGGSGGDPGSTALATTATPTAPATVILGDTLPWPDLLAHFRHIQRSHERFRRRGHHHPYIAPAAPPVLAAAPPPPSAALQAPPPLPSASGPPVSVAALPATATATAMAAAAATAAAVPAAAVPASASTILTAPPLAPLTATTAGLGGLHEMSPHPTLASPVLPSSAQGVYPLPAATIGFSPPGPVAAAIDLRPATLLGGGATTTTPVVKRRVVKPAADVTATATATATGPGPGTGPGTGGASGLLVPSPASAASGLSGGASPFGTASGATFSFGARAPALGGLGASGPGDSQQTTPGEAAPFLGAASHRSGAVGTPSAMGVLMPGFASTPQTAAGAARPSSGQPDAASEALDASGRSGNQVMREVGAMLDSAAAADGPVGRSAAAVASSAQPSSGATPFSAKRL